MEAGAGSVAGWQRAAEGHDEGSGTLAAWPSDQHPVTEIKGRRGPMCGQILWCRFRSVEMIDEHSNA